ncbi:hypothetical protein [Haloferula sargassicola]|uniref:Methyltransferase domain-containing protein n=1 Tax=Haloferula sargassicola TaxID=490096 RepID=A0ABP9UM36_9BACT
MALLELTLRPERTTEVPDEVAAYLDEADRREAAFFEQGLGKKFSRYVPSDPVAFLAALVYLRKEKLLRGSRFCEWGCGFGFAASLAAMEGFESYGIEFVPELAELAEQLAADFGLEVTILNTDYLPDGFDDCEGVGGKILVCPNPMSDPPEYDGLDPAEVDLFYVFPWPGEERLMMDLFEAVATEGAILLMYLGDGELAAYLKDEC